MSGGDAGAVRADLRYFNRPSRPGAVPVLATPEDRRALTSRRTVLVHDARRAGRGGGPRLAANGVELARHRSAVRDFNDPAEVKDTYYAEIAAVVKNVTGAEYAFPFNYQLRSEDPQHFSQAYARFVHIDTHIDVFSSPGGGEYVARLRRALVRRGVPERTAAVLDVCTVNTWQPRDQPVQRHPLAVIDAATVDVAHDLVPYQYAGSGLSSLVSVSNNATTSVGAAFNAAHRWLYWPRMETDEVLVFKQMDTRRGEAACGFHTSFDDPTSPPGAPGRRSIETRVLCAFAPRAAQL